MVELFWGKSYTFPSSTGNEVFNMPGAISEKKKKKQTKKLSGSPARELNPFPYVPPCAPLFLLLKLDFFFHILLQIQLLWGRERLLFCL